MFLHSSSTNVSSFHPDISSIKYDGSCHLLAQVSTLDGVLEVRNEHFWTVGFGSLVCDRVRPFGSNGKGQRPTPVLL